MVDEFAHVPALRSAVQTGALRDTSDQRLCIGVHRSQKALTVAIMITHMVHLRASRHSSSRPLLVTNDTRSPLSGEFPGDNHCNHCTSCLEIVSGGLSNMMHIQLIDTDKRLQWMSTAGRRDPEIDILDK